VTGPLPGEIERVLHRGSFCYAAAKTRHGPHVTPLVFVLSDGRVWLTTSRGSVKARAWDRDPRVAGLVRGPDAAVVFAGRAWTYDLLEPSGWERTARRVLALTAASVRFTRKNARFFAGYAVDARRVPLAWTPPGRVFVEIELERAAIVDQRGVRERWGDWEPSPASWSPPESFRARRSGPGPLSALPADVVAALDQPGPTAVALARSGGIVVLPGTWTVGGPDLYAALSGEVLDLAGDGPDDAPVAVAVDRPSPWRAREMVGAMVQGAVERFDVEGLRSGAASALRIVRASGVDRVDASLLRVRPSRLVWWRGWRSGSVSAT
jgi:Pyridoxamine 5'-phosphate oxidase